MSFDREIDFVVLWVNGNDPKWLEEFDSHTKGLSGDIRRARFRDWDNLQYLFRAFDQCAPWVRTIHFVTWGHLPEWLDVDHEKINVVNHDEILAEEFRPVFSSHPPEINMHRIKNLAERFVYFNDDMFLLEKIETTRFFKGGLPRDSMSFNAISVSPIAHILLSDLQVINRNFNKYSMVVNNFLKVFNFRYGIINLMKTFFLLPWPKMTGFTDPHQPQPFLKSTFEELWAQEPEVLINTSGAKTRGPEDVNQYLFRYWQLCNGCFCPVSFKKTYSKLILSYQDALSISRKILSGKYEMICVNDGLSDSEFEKSREIINGALKQRFPEKSTYEL